MKVVACIKTVPDERDIRVNSDRTLSWDAATKIGAYDLNALEAGAALVDADPEVEFIAMTVTTAYAANSKTNKDILARGPARLITVQGIGEEQKDSLEVASALAKGITDLGGVDLVVCGAGSGDMYSRQTGLLLGALLGWPALNEVKHFEVREGEVAVSRSGDGSDEEYMVALPCVLSVTADINAPRVSSMKSILAAGRKPADLMSMDGFTTPMDGVVEVVSVLAPEKAERKQIVLPDASESSVDEFYRLLRAAL
jgi:electron transfer flavoprotein beta subunit